jgi:hypothetical protein
MWRRVNGLGEMAPGCHPGLTNEALRTGGTVTR